MGGVSCTCHRCALIAVRVVFCWNKTMTDQTTSGKCIIIIRCIGMLLFAFETFHFFWSRSHLGLVYMSEKVTFLLKISTFLVIYLPHLNFPPFLNEGVSTGRTEFWANKLPFLIKKRGERICSCRQGFMKTQTDPHLKNASPNFATVMQLSCMM